MRVELLRNGNFVFIGTIRLSEGKIILDFKEERHKDFFSSEVYYGDKYYFPEDGENYMKALKAFANSTAIALSFETDEERRLLSEKIIKK